MRLRILQNFISSFLLNVKKNTYALQTIRIILLVAISHFLLTNCQQEEPAIVKLQFQELEDHITVSNEDYAMIFNQDKVSIQLGEGIPASSMKLYSEDVQLIDNQVIYKDIAEATDLIFYDKGSGNAGYDIHLRPRGNLEEVKIPLEDAENAYITGDGQLAIPIEKGEIRHSKPYAYQEINDEKIEVDSRFALVEGILLFKVDTYDEAYELVIDPEISFVPAEEEVLLMPFEYEVTPNAPIPDNGCGIGNYLETTINVSDNILVNDINIGLVIDHTFRGDLEVILVSPTGTSQTMFNFLGGGANNFDILLDSDASPSISTIPTGGPGSSHTTSAPDYTNIFAPEVSNALDIFDGENAMGNWIVRICDNANQDTGSLFKAKLEIDGTNACTATEVAGIVFVDSNVDGVQDDTEYVLENITVRAFDDNGEISGSPQTTDVNGRYSFTGLSVATDYRLELNLNSGFQATHFGTDAPTALQIATSGSCDYNFGLYYPGETCISENPRFAVSCFTNGDPTDPSNNGEVSIVGFSADFNDWNDPINENSPAATKVNIEEMQNVGPIWGMALDSETEQLYMNAVVKRHVGAGPDGIGVVYQKDYNTAPGLGLSVYYDFGVTAGIIPNNATRFSTGIGSSPERLGDNIDPDVFDDVGKTGLGGVAINVEGDSVFVVNAFDRNLYVLTGNAGSALAIPIAAAPWLSNSLCNGTGIERPWGVTYFRGKVYVGVVCDGSNSSCIYEATPCNDLVGQVYAWDGTNWATQFTTPIPLNYLRDFYNDGDLLAPKIQYWQKWADVWDINATANDMKGFLDGNVDAQFGQPLIGSIAFTPDGGMIIGMLDRTTLQMGYVAPAPDAPDAGDINEYYFSHGDMLRAVDNGSTFVLENDGTAGSFTGSGVDPGAPGGQEFFDDVWAIQSGDVGLGNVATLPGTEIVITGISDPLPGDFVSAGMVYLNSRTGERVRAIEVYDEWDGPLNMLPVTLGIAKAGGLGATAFNCGGTSTNQIGSRVWADVIDSDGVQDPSEDGLSGVNVSLYNDAGILLATTTTDTDGNWFFTADGTSGETWTTPDDEIMPNTKYYIVFGDTQFSNGSITLSGQDYVLTQNNASGSNTENDSNPDPAALTSDANAPAAIPDGLPLICVTTANQAGATDHSLDMGLFASDCSLTINSSTPDATCSSGTYDVDFALTWTDAPTTGGFEASIDGGTTFTTVTRTNLAASGSETITLAGVTCDGMLKSVVIRFEDDMTCLAMDTYTAPADPILGAIGNYVWLDENSDGLQDAGESGIPNVRVILRDENGIAIDTTVTDSDGGYLFPDLPEAMYFVDVDETTLPDTDGNGATQDLTQTTIYTNVVDGSDADLDNDDGDFGNKDHTGDGYKITLDEGEENLTADFGYNYNPTDDVNNPTGSPLGALGDRVWYDADQDGVQDPNEAGVEGVTVKLIAASDVTVNAVMYTAGDQITTDVTDANGYYLFDGLPAGAYNVMVVETGSPINGYEQTGDPDHFATSEVDNPDDTVEDDGMTTNPVVLGPGDVFLNVDFGYDNDNDLGAIGDYVWLDADADGNGPNATGATGIVVNQGNGAEDDAEETPISGVSVALIKDTNGDGKWNGGEPIIATDITDASGLYYFPALSSGSGEDYLVVITDTDNVLDGLKPTYDSDGGTMEVDVNPDDQMSNMELGMSSVQNLLDNSPVLDQDFGYTPKDQDAGEGLIGDYVWFDTNEDGVQDPEESGIEGVKVELYDLGDDEMIGGTGADEDILLATTCTDENGYYYFPNLPVDGDGEIYQVKIAESTGASGEDNFDAGAPLEGLINTSDPDSGTANPDDMGGVVSIDTNNPIDLDQDFGYVGDPNATLGSIGNKIWEDTNADGDRDVGEAGINGVTVDLYRDLDGNGQLDPGEPKIGSTITQNLMGEDGMYLFDNLPLDDYIVDVSDTDDVLTGYWHSLGNQDPNTNVIDNGTDDIADDANGGTTGDNSKTDAFAVTIDATIPNNLNVDFGYYKEPAALGNYVWLDADGDGQQDVDESGIENVVVSIMVTYPDGTMITLTDTTNADGFYEFPNLLLDEDYRVGIGEDTDGGTPEGTGINAALSNAYDPSGTLTPLFVIKVDQTQAALDGFVPTLQDETNGGITDNDDSDNFSGVVAIPVQGNEDTDLFKVDGTLTDANDEEVEASYDFGAKPILGAIGNYVWIDENSDGFQDAGEVGIPNVRVILRDMNGVALDSTVTDFAGNYLFPNLEAAMYFVDVDETTLPDTDGNAGTQDLTQTTTYTNEIDADLDGTVDEGDFGNKNHDGNGYKITLGAGEENLTADFGYNYNPTDDVNDPMGSPLGALGDRVWYDADQDGVQDPEEAGVEGVTVKLIAASDVTVSGTPYVAGDQITTDVTDANGYYLFDGLPAGAYNVMVTTAGSPIDGYEQTGDPDHFATSEADNPDDTVEDDDMTTKPVVLGPGDVFLNVDFGYDNDADLGAIGDYVWLDADADGNGPNVAGATGVTVNQGNTAEDDVDEQPISGVSVALIKDTNGDGKWNDGEPIIATNVTDADGLYYFPGLPAGNGEDYLVVVTDKDNILQGLKPTYDSDGGVMETQVNPEGQMSNMELGISSVMNLTAGMGNEVVNQDFGYTPIAQDAGEGLIGDYVWFDTNEDGVQDPDEAGIEGVKMELYDLGDDNAIGGVGVNADVLLSTTTTDENGYYYFGGLLVDADGESYQVKVSETGDCDNFAVGAPLEGLANTSDPDNGTTDPDDNMGGVVTIDTNDPIDLDQDFGYVGDPNATLGSIGNKIWEDSNADGDRDTGESGINGVTVDLYRDLNGNDQLDPGEPKIGSTVTQNLMGEDGMYLFDNLPLDDYIVDVSDTDDVLTGYWHSLGNQDPNTNVTGDTADDANGGATGDNSKNDAFAVTIDATIPNNLNVDFGYYKEPAALGNYVWMDSNQDGIQDGGEMGINDVVVTMMIEYPDATMITLETTTVTKDGKLGYYEFPNLLYDEDYATGSGSAEGSPAGVSTTSATPKYTIKVITTGQDLTGQALEEKVPTVVDFNGAGMQPSDAESIGGVNAVPVQGSKNTDPQTDETTEANEAIYDFGFTTDLVGIGGTIFNDDNEDGGTAAVERNNGIQDDGLDIGIGEVQVVLIDINGNRIDSTFTNPDGTYLFEGLTPGMYKIEVPASNFLEALSAFDFNSSPTNTADDDTDNTDRGMQASTDGTVMTAYFNVTVGNEPTENEINTMTQDGTDTSARDASTNTVVDLGFQTLVLPVELLGFHAKADKDHIDLTWSTASELNNSHFELERSEDSKVFKQIARIEGQGTTLEQSDYLYEDQDAIPGVLYYYRLKQVDIDGVFEYSEIRTARLEAEMGGMDVYPNPIGDDLELKVDFYTDDLVAEFIITDIHNRSILQVKQDLQQSGWNSITIDIAALPAGTYILMDKVGNIRRFVKARE